VGFFTPDFDNKLKKVLVRGGPPQILCDAYGQAPSGSWGADDTIVFSLDAPGLFSVPATGGSPRVLIPPDSKQADHQRPEILPGGHSVLFHIVPLGGTTDDSNIAVLSLQTGEYRTLIEGGQRARYAPTGHVVFGRAGALWAVPFDLNRLETTGPEAPILEGIQMSRSGVAPYSFSDDGLLVYLPVGEVATKRTLVWVDREGNEESLSAEPRAYLYPRLSPDGSRLAVTVDDSGNRDIWIYDLGRQTLTRLTFDAAAEQVSVWTPDGQRVVFRSDREGASSLFWKAADGTGQVERLRTSPNFHLPSSFSPDGKSLVFYEREGSSPYDIGVLSMEGERTSKPLLQNEFDEMRPAISRDGSWIAYMSNEAGRGEIYVRPFPNVEDAKWQISSDGGISPFWAANGEELFYSNGEAMMVVKIETESSFRHGRPQVLFSGSYVFAGARNYDISPDGKRFLMIKEAEQTGETGTELIVVENWFSEIKRLVPTP
jgi:serine/threonine-protein kinase